MKPTSRISDGRRKEAEETWSCPHCQKTVRIANRFCIGCGAPMPEFVAQALDSNKKVRYHLEGSKELTWEKRKKWLTGLQDEFTQPRRMMQLAAAAAGFLILAGLLRYVYKRVVVQAQAVRIVKTVDDYYFHLANGDADELLDRLGHYETPANLDDRLAVAEKIETAGRIFQSFAVSDCQTRRFPGGSAARCKISFQLNPLLKDEPAFPNNIRKEEPYWSNVRLENVGSGYRIVDAEMPRNYLVHFDAIESAVKARLMQ